MQNKKPNIKQIGNVVTEVISISVIIFLFAPAFLASPPPTIDKLFTFPVLIGIPKTEQIKRVMKEPTSEKKAKGVSKLSTDFDRELIIFLPPIMVEKHMTRETIKINDNGILVWLLLVPNKKSIMAMNF